MTEARLVWDTWRRILTSDALVDGVLQPPQDFAPLGLTPSETAILADYAGTRAATDQTIFMFRSGLVRNALCALRLVPLSDRLLHTSNLDVQEVTRDFTASIDYRDDGPHLWRLAAAFVAYLTQLAAFAGAPKRDLLAMDAIAIALMRHLADHPPDRWPSDAVVQLPPHENSHRYVASAAAAVASTRCDLTPWLESPFAFDVDATLDPLDSHWLIYLPNADAAPTYAELTARAARAFTHLRTPKTAAQLAAELNLAVADVLALIDSLAGLGVVTLAAGADHDSSGPSHRTPLHLPDDALIVLDPAVETLGEAVDAHVLLCHTALDVGMAVPPGEGLFDVVKSMTDGPVRVGDLRAQYDDAALVDEILISLARHRFARVTPPLVPAAPMRRAIVIELDSASDVVTAWQSGGPAPEVLLRCARLSDHSATLRELAIRRRDGTLRAHHVVVRADDVRCGHATRQSLLHLGAAVEIDHVAWPAPAAPIDGLAELAGDLIATHVIMTAGISLLDASARSCCVGWMSLQFVSGLCLRIEGEVTPLAGLFDAVRELEDLLGDVVIVNMPRDEVLLGNTDRGWLAGETAADTLRREYVRWRLPLLKFTEGQNCWAQVPAVEDRWVRAAEDLLPNAPALLGVGPSHTIIDLCGGLGRVARRLSPAVGAGGIVISIERRRFMVERARRFALEGNFTNLQFRVGCAERLPLPDCVMDAAVNEWTGAIWELGLGPAMLKEMARVVRPGGRVAVTHRLVQLNLETLHEPWVQYPEIYRWVRDAFRHPKLTIVAERVWGQIVPSQTGDHANEWREAHLPRLVDPNNYLLPADDPQRGTGRADVFLTTIAEIAMGEMGEATNKPRQPSGEQ